jgi:D-3-phosphoglycerate dehydrogenase / 2-oxoglutarate reductase
MEKSTPYVVLFLGPTDAISEVEKTLGERYQVISIEATESRIIQVIGQCHAIIDASMRVRISRDLINSANLLEIISAATTGSDHIDQEALDSRGISLHTLKDDAEFLKNITPAAELSWALLMALARNLEPAIAHVKQGLWVRENFPGKMLWGKRLGVVGCGRIGQWVARYGQAFGMEIYGFDPYLEKFPEFIHGVSLDALAQLCDFVSVHVHLSEGTRELISRKFIQNMRNDAVLINTSRGLVVNESALLDALKSGEIGGYGADVLSGEPRIRDHPLVKFSRESSNVIITPHCGGYSPEAVRMVCAHAARKIIEHFAKTP